MAGGANPNIVQPTANPYNQASMAQMGAMGRTAQGMGQTAATGMGAYQNPYDQSVVDRTLRDVGGAAQIGLNTLDAQAGSAGAYGGSRHGIAMAEAAKGYQQQALDKVGALRQQGFNTALGASQADLSRQMQAANQLANLGQQSFGYGQAIGNQQMQQGALQQALMQNLANAGSKQYQGYTGQPLGSLNTLLQTLAGQPDMKGQTSSFNPGLFNYLQTAAMMTGG
jgi:hypothetical protein